MSEVITSQKKFCPYCLWTQVTNLTHCPKVADSPSMHNLEISVPLEVCKEDTSAMHKYSRRQPIKTSDYNSQRALKAREDGGDKVPRMEINVSLEKIAEIKHKAGRHN